MSDTSVAAVNRAEVFPKDKAKYIVRGRTNRANMLPTSRALNRFISLDQVTQQIRAAAQTASFSASASDSGDENATTVREFALVRCNWAQLAINLIGYMDAHTAPL